MNPILRVVLLCASSLAWLAACGGDGPSAPPPHDGSGMAPASTCVPPSDTFEKRLLLGATYEDSVKAMGCAGRLISEVVAEGVTVRLYDWGNIEAGPYVQVEFRNNSLNGWSAQGRAPAQVPPAPATPASPPMALPSASPVAVPAR